MVITALDHIVYIKERIVGAATACDTREATRYKQPPSLYLTHLFIFCDAKALERLFVAFTSLLRHPEQLMETERAHLAVCRVHGSDRHWNERRTFVDTPLSIRLALQRHYHVLLGLQ